MTSANVLNIVLTALVVGLAVAAASAWRYSRLEARARELEFAATQRQSDVVLERLATLEQHVGRSEDALLGALTGSPGPTGPTGPLGPTGPTGSTGAEAAPRLSIGAGRPEGRQDQYTVVRELSHSLKTPLAGMESILERIKLGRTNDLPTTDVRDLLASVDICKAVIAAFRELTRVSTEAQAWAPRSVSQMLASSHEVYNRALGRATSLEADLPDAIPGYSSNFVVALMLPLLENAIEASPQNAPITVQYRNRDRAVLLCMVNHIDPVGQRIGEAAHEGLGLQTVRRLVVTDAEGSFDCERDGNAFTATVTLPRRRAAK